MRCLDDLISARRAARHRIAKQLLRHGHVFEGKRSWTLAHGVWVARQRREDPLADEALTQMRVRLVSLDVRSRRLSIASRRSPARSPGRTRRAG
jgi:transposase